MRKTFIWCKNRVLVGIRMKSAIYLGIHPEITSYLAPLIRLPVVLPLILRRFFFLIFYFSYLFFYFYYFFVKFFKFCLLFYYLKIIMIIFCCFLILYCRKLFPFYFRIIFENRVVFSKST